jgi:hypothetical protein
MSNVSKLYWNEIESFRGKMKVGGILSTQEIFDICTSKLSDYARATVCGYLRACGYDIDPTLPAQKPKGARMVNCNISRQAEIYLRFQAIPVSDIQFCDGDILKNTVVQHELMGHLLCEHSRHHVTVSDILDNKDGTVDCGVTIAIYYATINTYNNAA